MVIDEMKRNEIFVRKNCNGGLLFYQLLTLFANNSMENYCVHYNSEFNGNCMSKNLIKSINNVTILSFQSAV